MASHLSPSAHSTFDQRSETIVSDHEPSTPIAVFKLPVPVTALPYIVDCIERVYGTGETMMRPDGDSFQIVAPADGFGPIKTGGRRPSRPDEVDMKLRHQRLRDGTLTLDLEDSTEAVKILAMMMKQWFDLVGGINYVEVQLSTPGEETEWVFTLQRKAGQTPHELRSDAEARIAKLEAEIAALRTMAEASGS